MHVSALRRLQWADSAARREAAAHLAACRRILHLRSELRCNRFFCAVRIGTANAAAATFGLSANSNA